MKVAIVCFSLISVIRGDLADSISMTFPKINAFLIGVEKGVKQSDNITISAECFGEEVENDLRYISNAISDGNFLVVYVSTVHAMDKLFRSCHLNE